MPQKILAEVNQFGGLEEMPDHLRLDLKRDLLKL